MFNHAPEYGFPTMSQVEIDGVVQSYITEDHTFNTLGKHTVKCTPITPNEIVGGTFENSEMESIIVPDNFTSLGQGMITFANCNNLKQFIIGSGITSEYDIPFEFQSLETIIVSDNNPIFDSRDNCNAIIKTSNNEMLLGCKNTIIPNSVTSIKYAFEGVTAITSVGIIGSGASLEIPNNVSRLEVAFGSMPNLTSATIPSSVSYVGEGLFDYSNNLESVTFLSETPPTLIEGLYIPNNCQIYVPSSSVNAYKTADVWNQYSSRIQAIPAA